MGLKHVENLERSQVHNKRFISAITVALWDDTPGSGALEAHLDITCTGVQHMKVLFEPCHSLPEWYRIFLQISLHSILRWGLQQDLLSNTVLKIKWDNEKKYGPMCFTYGQFLQNVNLESQNVLESHVLTRCLTTYHACLLMGTSGPLVANSPKPPMVRRKISHSNTWDIFFKWAKSRSRALRILRKRERETKSRSEHILKKQMTLYSLREHLSTCSFLTFSFLLSYRFLNFPRYIIVSLSSFWYSRTIM